MIWSQKGDRLHGFGGEGGESQEEEKEEEGGGKVQKLRYVVFESNVFWMSRAFRVKFYGELMLLGLGFWKRSPKP